ncbi:hypothetical protein [Ruegeria sp. HKCCD7318]|uniref:Cap15 family cyclic dinucleotide receptor domain-containing protein n=1 Tax=Ruegeria sp. HKCCD7318 TaxID=2683014 RepID=UPI001492CAB1|nr:hypothetical protein [Ruegeria sp. HKCCD7318]NOE32169.1 hypothetical protein [Ruegeria sp. HKCCD7318]
MSNTIDIKVLVSLTVAVFAFSLFCLSYFGIYNLTDPTEFFRAYSAALTVTTSAVALLVWQGWKIPWLKGWLILVPNLNGTWEGVTKSDWVNPETNEKLNPITSLLIVKQSLFGMSCVVRTGEMTSFSISAGIERDPNNHIEKLVYTYRSEPKPGVAGRSAIHHGTAVLEFGTNPSWSLSGRYFTERNSTGEIELAFRNRRTNTQLTDEERKHPLDK